MEENGRGICMSEKCLKEYANNDCYISELKYEKGKLHTRYLLAIAIGLIILSVLIATNGGTEFSNQLSMGSTISSIILSAIAIFMSISGENKMSGIQNQMIETSTKMSKIVNQIENANDKIVASISDKLEKMDVVVETLEGIGGDIREVKGKVQDISSLFSGETKEVRNRFKKEDIYKMYLCVMESKWENVRIQSFRKIVLLILITWENKDNFNDRLLNEFMKNHGGEKWKHVYLGMLSLLVMVGFNKNKEFIDYFKMKIEPQTEEVEEIKELIDKMKNE